MSKYPTIIEGKKDGFSDWIKPKMKGYRMACCDCGLVHDLDFKVVKQTKIIKKYKDGNHLIEYENVRSKKYQIALRAKRNKRSTGQIRKNTNHQFNKIDNDK